MRDYMKPGIFITVEGIEGVGKTTSVKVIEAFLSEHNIEHIVTREPGGTVIAEKIRNILLHHEGEEICIETELLLFFAARNQHCKHIIIPAIKKGIWVVCDRFVDASYAYQGGGRGIESRWIDALSDLIDLPKPKLTILLDASTEVVQKRLQDRGVKDRIEKEEQEFFDRIKQTYLQLARAKPEQYYTINTDFSLDEVKMKLQEVLLEYI